ncbi:hypothetical protein BGX34_010270 [Mortierella sp. NVP85]|nr:hypothetical protein BGX34_010270 [Mortierella sp. NVP85]
MVNLNCTKNQLKGFFKQGRPSAMDREKHARRKREQNLKDIRPGSLAHRVFFPQGQSQVPKDQAVESQAGPSQGTPATDDPQTQVGLRVVAGKLQWGLDDQDDVAPGAEADVEADDDVAAVHTQGRMWGGRERMPRLRAINAEAKEKAARDQAEREAWAAYYKPDPNAFVEWRDRFYGVKPPPAKKMAVVDPDDICSLDPEVVGDPSGWDWDQTSQPDDTDVASPIVVSQEAIQDEGTNKRKRQEEPVQEIVSVDRVSATLPEPTQEQLGSSSMEEQPRSPKKQKSMAWSQGSGMGSTVAPVQDWQEAVQLLNRLCEFIRGLTDTKDGTMRMGIDDFLEVEQCRKQLSDVCWASQQEYARTAEDLPSDDDLEGCVQEEMAEYVAQEDGVRRAIKEGLGAAPKDLGSAPAQVESAEAATWAELLGSTSQGVTQPMDLDEGSGMDSLLDSEEEREQVRTAGRETLQRMLEEEQRLLQEKIASAVRSFKRQKTVAVGPEERIRFLDRASKDLRRDLEAEGKCARLLAVERKKKAVFK